MTVKSPRRPARFRGVRAVVAAVVAAAVALGGTAPAVSAASPPPAHSAPVLLPGTTAFTLAPAANGMLRPGDPLTVSVLRQNATATTLPAAQVVLAIGDAPLRDRDALSRWLAGEVGQVATQPIAQTPIAAVPRGAEVTEGMVVDAADPALTGRAAGVYPLVATVGDGVSAEVATSVVVVPDDAAVEVGIVVPITAGPLTDALLSADEVAELTAPGGALSTQLDAIDGTTAILAIDPALLAAVRRLGSRAPESATTWLQRLVDLPNSRFALQFGDADPAVQLDAGLARPLPPLPLSATLTPADFAPVAPAVGATPTASPTPTPTPTPDPSPTAEPGEIVLPTLDELLDIPGAAPDVYWPSPATTGSDAVAGLGGLGTDDVPSLTLLPSTSLTADVGGRAAIEGAQVMVSDADASRTLSEASVLDSPPLRGAALAAASAYLTFAADAAPGAAVVVALERTLDHSRVGLRAAVSAVETLPGALPRSLADLAAIPGRAATMADIDPDQTRVSAATALLSDEAELARFATVLDEPTLLTGPERGEVLQLLGVAWSAAPVEAAAAVAEHREQTAATLDAVALQPTSTINLLGSDARLWFTVRNDLPYPVNLVLYASPDDLRLNVQRANPFDATPASNTRIEVPVQARLGNGEVTLSLQLRSRTSVAIGDPQTVEVNVRAEWESVGLVALGVLVGGLLVMGVVRTVLKLRGRGKDASPEPERKPGPGTEPDAAEGRTP